MKEIKLHHGEICFVDDEDFSLLSRLRWHVSKRSGNQYPYAVTKSLGGTIYMHRLIMGGNHLGKKEIDHINRNTLDNRKSNLRFTTRSVNAYNHKILSSNRSGVNGVFWNKRTKRWRACAGGRESYVQLGEFLQKEDAIAARQKFDTAMFVRP